MDKQEIKKFFYCKISQCWTGKLTPKGYMDMEWQVGCGQHRYINVCRKAFIQSYNIPHTTVDNICANLKKGLTNNELNIYND
jgi:hypothetical protein